MGALPKKKMAKSRSRKRHGQLKINQPTIVTCQHCHQPMLAHTMCPQCGYYREKEIISPKKVKKVTRS